MLAREHAGLLVCTNPRATKLERFWRFFYENKRKCTKNSTIRKIPGTYCRPHTMYMAAQKCLNLQSPPRTILITPHQRLSATYWILEEKREPGLSASPPWSVLCSQGGFSSRSAEPSPPPYAMGVGDGKHVSDINARQRGGLVEKLHDELQPRFSQQVEERPLFRFVVYRGEIMRVGVRVSRVSAVHCRDAFFLGEGSNDAPQ